MNDCASHTRTATITALAASALVSMSAYADTDDPAETISVTGIVRDFLPEHPDFNVVPGNGYGHYCGNVATELDEDGKPAFTGEGFRVAREWRDDEGRQIAWCLFDADRGDKQGKAQLGDAAPAAISSAGTFSEWFRDVLGVNQSTTHSIEMNRGSDGIYRYQTNDFHPIDGSLFGNGQDSRNEYFTFEVVASFVYEADEDQMLEFKGDDDLWVFIDGRLVADLGGIAGNSTQHVELDRLGLSDGETYSLHFFLAERHQPKSHFRLATNILLETANRIPTMTMQFD